MRTPTTSMHQLFTEQCLARGRQQEPACECGCFKTNKASSKAATLIRGLAVMGTGFFKPLIRLSFGLLLNVLTYNLRKYLNLGRCRKTRKILWYHYSIQAISPIDSAPYCTRTYSVLDLPRQGSLV